MSTGPQIKAPKVLYMGKEVDFEGLPEAEPTLEAAFKPVILSPKAIDLASQLVPSDAWMPRGLHTWLQLRADAAYRKLKVGATEISGGQLKYIFEYRGDQPILARIVRY